VTIIDAPTWQQTRNKMGQGTFSRRDADGNPIWQSNAVNRMAADAQRAAGRTSTLLGHIWTDEYTSTERTLWNDAAWTTNGARPQGQPPYGDGWKLFLCTCSQPLKTGTGARQHQSPGTGNTPTLMQLLTATVGTQKLAGLITYASPPPASNPNDLYIYQIDPLRLGSLRPERFTAYLGHLEISTGGAPTVAWEFDAAYPFASGDLVACLIRHHSGLAGVSNAIDSATA